MPSPDTPSQRLILIDDDMLTREVLTLLAEEASFDVEAYESGEEALEALAQSTAPSPQVILADMQMDGIFGDTLARLLRSACGPATAILAMSGTAVQPHVIQSFDGFLLKPFSIDDLRAAIAGQAEELAARLASTAPAQPLNLNIYNAFRAGMTAEQLSQFYTMSLDDAERRIGLMRQAVADNDGDAYRRAAHAIKGGCGMVGAAELAALAARMEENGPESIDNIGAFDEFLAASQRLRRILDPQSK